MPSDDDLDEGTPGGEGTDGASSLHLTPEAVRNSPEFKALEKQNRQLARQKGTAETAAAAARTEAENVRQAAEAERQAVLSQQLISTLGESGIAAYTEIAELSATDPVAAAQRLKALMESAAQSAAPKAPEAPTTTSEGTESNVANATSQRTPPPPSHGLDGGTPLSQGSTGEDQATVIAGLEKTYADVVARNQNFSQRNRVTMKDRANGFISYLGAAYLKSGAKPKS